MAETRDGLILSITQFQKAIESFLSDPGEIPLLRMRKDLRRRICPLQTGIGGLSKRWGHGTLISTGLLNDNPVVAELQGRMKQRLETGAYFCHWCEMCPLSRNQRCNLDEFYVKVRARMSFQQKIKGKNMSPEAKKSLDAYYAACSDVMSSCLIGLIELSAILSSIVDGEKHD